MTIQTTAATKPTCEAQLHIFDRPEYGPSFCRRQIGLRSLLDRRGTRRYYCTAEGHRGLVVRNYGEAMYEGME